jgi:hypothetical protein
MWRFHLQNRFRIGNMIVMLGTTQVPQKPTQQDALSLPFFMAMQLFQLSGNLEFFGIVESRGNLLVS